MGTICIIIVHTIYILINNFIPYNFDEHKKVLFSKSPQIHSSESIDSKYIPKFK